MNAISEKQMSQGIRSSFYGRWLLATLGTLIALGLVWIAELGLRWLNWPTILVGLLLITGWSGAFYCLSLPVVRLVEDRKSINFLLFRYINLFLAGLAIFSGITLGQVPRALLITAAAVYGMTLAHQRKHAEVHPSPGMIRLEGSRIIFLVFVGFMTIVFYLAAPGLLPI